MKRLNHRDLQTLLSALSVLHADFNAKTLPQRTLEAIDKIIPGEVIFSTHSTLNLNISSTVGQTGKIYTRLKG